MKQFDLENDEKINSGFKIPDRYFDTLESQIFNKVSKKEVPIISFSRSNKHWFTAIAAIFIISFFGLLYFNSVQDGDISNEDYLVYENHLNDEDFATLLSDADLIEMEKSVAVIDTKQDLENYIY